MKTFQPLGISEDNFIIRIHLDDAGETNGSLGVVPGSHAKGVYRAGGYLRCPAWRDYADVVGPKKERWLVKHRGPEWIVAILVIVQQSLLLSSVN
ncbi:phytanoyl-CoA dioxygenase family protein [Dyadobacter sp. SG02]|uniref:phytanoyl-CoA dioxygenase family protein n=1 Tax=Dyadobacter sp. SG02 TaxID=1855291 RepID=UPI0015A55B9C